MLKIRLAYIVRDQPTRPNASSSHDEIMNKAIWPCIPCFRGYSMRRKSTRKGTRNNNTLAFPSLPIRINTLIHFSQKPLDKENYLYDFLNMEIALQAKSAL